MKEEILLLDYEEVLENIENKECHLLLGNGFNIGLGVDTSYKAIFEEMLQEDNQIYIEYFFHGNLF